MSSTGAFALQILLLFIAGILIIVNNNNLLSVVPDCSLMPGGSEQDQSFESSQKKMELESLRELHLGLENQLHAFKEDYRQAQARVNKLQMKFHESDKRLRLLELSEKMTKNEQNDDSLLPDFIIMGTWKGGTTSLYNIFQQHPSICMAIGEVNYFTNPSIKHLGLGLYQRFFQRCSQDRVLKYKNTSRLLIGEKSPTYLWNCHKICPLLKNVNPSVKLIVSLRDPIDRAYSQWSMDSCKGIFNGTFEEFIEKNPKALNAGIYLDQIQALVKSFPKKQLFLLKTEDFFNDTNTQLKKLEKFLGVEKAEFTREQLRAYGSSPKCKSRSQSTHTINEKTLARLIQFYKEPNQQLEEFMQKQFGWGSLSWK